MGTVKRSVVARGYGGEKEGYVGEILGTFEVNKIILCALKERDMPLLKINYHKIN